MGQGRSSTRGDTGAAVSPGAKDPSSWRLGTPAWESALGGTHSICCGSTVLEVCWRRR